MEQKFKPGDEVVIEDVRQRRFELPTKRARVTKVGRVWMTLCGEYDREYAYGFRISDGYYDNRGVGTATMRAWKPEEYKASLARRSRLVLLTKATSSYEWHSKLTTAQINEILLILGIE